MGVIFVVGSAFCRWFSEALFFIIFYHGGRIEEEGPKWVELLWWKLWNAVKKDELFSVWQNFWRFDTLPHYHIVIQDWSGNWTGWYFHPMCMRFEICPQTVTCSCLLHNISILGKVGLGIPELLNFAMSFSWSNNKDMLSPKIIPWSPKASNLTLNCLSLLTVWWQQFSLIKSILFSKWFIYEISCFSQILKPKNSF